MAMEFQFIDVTTTNLLGRLATAAPAAGSAYRPERSLAEPLWHDDETMSVNRGMSLDEGRQSQRPYRYGMVLLCAGALINWLGLAEEYAEPVRYVGVACIVAGALLICAAMCCWLQSPARSTPQHDRSAADTHQIDDPIHVISMPDEETMQQKPPDYDTVAGAPPTYDDAIKLNPARLLPTTSARRTSTPPPPPAAGPQIIPGQPDDTLPSFSETAAARTPVQVPKTPPPPYQPVRTIR